MLFEQFLTVLAAIASIMGLAILTNILQQLFLKNPNEPPIVFHWVPLIGSTVTYGIDPFKFFFDCQAKVRISSRRAETREPVLTRSPQYGDIYTFILLGRKVTVYLGSKGNQFILNGKLKDVNAEEIYSVLTTPVFGRDVIYDVPNAKFMEQKKVCNNEKTVSPSSELKAAISSSNLVSHQTLSALTCL